MFQPGSGVDSKLGAVPTDTIQGQVQSFSQVVVGFFPTNVVQSFSVERDHPDHPDRGHALGGLPRRWPRRSASGPGSSPTALEALKLVIFKVVGYVIRLTPYAIVALTAHMVGISTDLGKSFRSLLGLLALVWARASCTRTASTA